MENLDNTQPVNEALTVQIGGNHYKSAYQPIELMEKVNMHPACAFVFKYVYRHKNKKGLEDLQKALHCVELLESLGGKFYDGIDCRMVHSKNDAKEEFYKFIKANEQLDVNQIRAILAIMSEDSKELKKVIHAEIEEFYPDKSLCNE